jgi:hypothetical protein
MRKVVLWLTLTAVLASVITLVALTSAQAGHTPSASPVKGQRVSPNTVSGPKKLLQTKFSYGVGGAVAAGYAAIDSPINFACPGTTTCAYEAEQHVQVAGSTDGNLWAICTQIDGSFLSQPSCPFLGTVPNGTFGTGTFTQGASGIAHGPHTIQTFIYTEDGATVYNYQITYRVYRAA